MHVKTSNSFERYKVKPLGTIQSQTNLNDAQSNIFEEYNVKPFGWIQNKPFENDT